MRSLRAARIALSASLLLSLLLGMAAAQIPATDDSYTASSSPISNYCSQSQLNVIWPGVNSYIRYDLSALPSGLAGANVSKATMRLSINGVTTAGTFDVYEVTGSWTEGTITYNNAPPLGTKVASAIMIVASKRYFIDVDVTKAVQDWLNGVQANYGIALVASSGSSISVSFDSKENTSTSHDPELMVSMISAGPRDHKDQLVHKVRKDRVAQPALLARRGLKGSRGQPVRLDPQDQLGLQDSQDLRDLQERRGKMSPFLMARVI